MKKLQTLLLSCRNAGREWKCTSLEHLITAMPSSLLREAKETAFNPSAATQKEISINILYIVLYCTLPARYCCHMFAYIVYSHIQIAVPSWLPWVKLGPRPFYNFAWCWAVVAFIIVKKSRESIRSFENVFTSFDIQFDIAVFTSSSKMFEALLVLVHFGMLDYFPVFSSGCVGSAGWLVLSLTTKFWRIF